MRSRRRWVIVGVALVLAAIKFAAIDSASHSVSDTLIAFAPWALLLAVAMGLLLRAEGRGGSGG